MNLKLTLGLSASLAFAVLCGLAAAFLGGMEWQRGRDAIASVSDLRADVAALNGVAIELRDRGIEVATQFHDAQARLSAISQDHRHDERRLAQAFLHARSRFDAWITTRLDLFDCAIGADGMQLWNDAARGGGGAAGAATGGDAGPSRPLPADAAGADKRPDPGTGRQLHRSRRAVPPLPLPARAGDSGAGRL